MYKNLKAGDIIKFGSYEQDNNAGNGKEKIEWLVLKKADNKALLVSKYILDCQPVNTGSDKDKQKWETCDLREWLSSTFLNGAFTPEERSSIELSHVPADKNTENPGDPNLDPGNSTYDRLFLLSMLEVETYFNSYEARRCAGTPYAKSKGLYVAEYDKTADGELASYWWTRNPAHAMEQTNPFVPPQKTSGMAVVDPAGVMPAYGGLLQQLDTGVRPAMWLCFKD